MTENSKEIKVYWFWFLRSGNNYNRLHNILNRKVQTSVAVAEYYQGRWRQSVHMRETPRDDLARYAELGRPSPVFFSKNVQLLQLFSNSRPPVLHNVNKFKVKNTTTKTYFSYSAVFQFVNFIFQLVASRFEKLLSVHILETKHLTVEPEPQQTGIYYWVYW